MNTQFMPSLVSALTGVLPDHSVRALMQAFGNCQQPVQSRTEASFIPRETTNSEGLVSSGRWSPGSMPRGYLPSASEVAYGDTINYETFNFTNNYSSDFYVDIPAPPGFSTAPYTANFYDGNQFFFPTSQEFTLNNVYPAGSYFFGGNTNIQNVQGDTISFRNAMFDSLTIGGTTIFGDNFIFGGGGVGQPGVPGMPGGPSAPGMPGGPGAPGMPSLPGQPGAPAPPGPPGLPGSDGRDGRNGWRGMTGQRGERGSDGFNGFSGFNGFNGFNGRDGRDGITTIIRTGRPPTFISYIQSIFDTKAPTKELSFSRVDNVAKTKVPDSYTIEGGTKTTIGLPDIAVSSNSTPYSIRQPNGVTLAGAGTGAAGGTASLDPSAVASIPNYTGVKITNSGSTRVSVLQPSANSITYVTGVTFDTDTCTISTTTSTLTFTSSSITASSERSHSASLTQSGSTSVATAGASVDISNLSVNVGNLTANLTYDPNIVIGQLSDLKIKAGNITASIDPSNLSLNVATKVEVVSDVATTDSEETVVSEATLINGVLRRNVFV